MDEPIKLNLSGGKMKVIPMDKGGKKNEDGSRCLEKAFCVVEVAEILSKDLGKLLKRAMREEKKAGTVSENTQVLLWDRMRHLSKTVKDASGQLIEWHNDQMYEETAEETQARKEREQIEVEAFKAEARERGEAWAF